MFRIEESVHNKNEVINSIEWTIPKDWEVESVGNITSSLDSKRKAINSTARMKIKGDIPYWGANSIVDYVNDYLINETVVLIGEDAAPFFDKSKKVSFVSRGKIWPNNHIHVLKTSINEEYLSNALNKVEYSKIIGVTNRPKLTQEMLRNVEIPVAPIDQQNNIAEILSTQESVIEDVKSLIEQNERRLNYLSSELLSGRIRVKEENGETIFYKNPEENWKTVEMNGEDVEIPSDWLIEKNENLFRENPKSKIQAKKVGLYGTNPAFNCSPEQKYWSEEVIVLGENLFLSTGGSAAVHYYNGDAAYTTDVYSIKAKNIDPKLLFYILRDNLSVLNSIFYGAGLKHLNKKEFKDLKFCFPCSNESKLIVEVLNLQEDYIKDLKRLLALEEKRFQWLLDNLMSGKYIVTKEED